MKTRYIGRFAPSPTGPLHIGSLTCALGSFLDARAAGGQWLVRMEDLDPPREKPGAASAILRTLEEHGLHWDGDIVYQSQRLPLYETALAQLIRDGYAFRCSLTRTQLASIGPNHPGRATSAAQLNLAAGYAWRLDVPTTVLTCHDRIQGIQSFDLSRAEGPFVIKRRDGFFAYQLAVVVDDNAQGVTDIVRGADLLDSTPRQHWLQQCLGLPIPRHAHLPVLTDKQDRKLAKQHQAAPVIRTQRMHNLRLALTALGQPPQPDSTTPDELLAAALATWSMAAVPRQMTRRLTALTVQRTPRTVKNAPY